MSCPP